MKNELTEQVETSLDSIFDAINKMGGEESVEVALQSVLNKQHRTLQQNFMRQIIIPSLRIFAEKDSSGYTDLRNEATCKLATKLLPIIDKEHLPFI